MSVHIYTAQRPKRMPKYVQVGKTVYLGEESCRVLGTRGPLVECQFDNGKRVLHYAYLRRRSVSA